MQLIEYPGREEWKEILKRPVFETGDLDETVKSILAEIKSSGDGAVMRYTSQFDGVELDNVQVTKDEIDESAFLVPGELKDAILLAQDNIKKFHEKQINLSQRIETSPGVFCWQKSVAIEKVGLYIPGGTAPLFSTVLMLAVPAKIAGCREIILCSPPGNDGKIHPAILYAASITGVDKIFKIGGVQAIGAMAFGTETVPKVYKIFGPGNQYVTAAKQLVSREDVAIDMPAGPSEVAIIADDTSDPAFVASDLLSQAEHGKDSQVILITSNKELIDKVRDEVILQLEQLPRKDFTRESLKNSKIILMQEMEEIIDIINEYAPEHLIISTSDYMKIADKIINAGSVFLGHLTPESAGDYVSGTNHTLPTNGYAKMYNGVNLDDYVKKITFQEINEEGLKNIGRAVEIMAGAEDLQAHKNAVTLRLNKISK